MVETALLQKKINGLLLLCFENERPLKGTIAALDWRFDGHFTRLLQSQILTGRAGEALYAPLRWNNETFHFIVMGGGSMPSNGKSPAHQKILNQALDLADRLKLEPLGISSQDWNLSENEETSLREKRNLCILN